MDKCETLTYISNSLQNDKIQYQYKLKAFADDKINVAKKFKFVSGRVENIMGKGENAGFHIFSTSQNFQMASNTGSLKVLIMW